jgi:hypothetical protein
MLIAVTWGQGLGVIQLLVFVSSFVKTALAMDWFFIQGIP